MAGNTTGRLSFDDMHDIVVSEPVSWWPLAPGWYAVALVIIMALIWAAAKALKQWRENAYRREALRTLEAVSPKELPELVKRVSLSIWPRDLVASLSGDEWLHFLDRSGKTNDFSQGVGRLLLELSYNPKLSIQNEDDEYQQLIKAVRRWINQSRTGFQPVDNPSEQLKS